MTSIIPLLSFVVFMISEHELKLNEMSSSIKEEVQILRGRLGEIRQEVIHGSVNISQEAAQLQNLLNACKAGLTSLQGRIDGSHYKELSLKCNRNTGVGCRLP